MIGGIDVCIPTRADKYAMEASVRAIRQHWKNAVFENAETGDFYEHFWNIPFSEIKELFAYVDEKSAKLWEEEGAVPETKNTMIHILTEPGYVTVVIDENDENINQITDTIRSALADVIHCLEAA